MNAFIASGLIIIVLVVIVIWSKMYGKNEKLDYVTENKIKTVVKQGKHHFERAKKNKSAVDCAMSISFLRSAQLLEPNNTSLTKISNTDVGSLVTQVKQFCTLVHGQQFNSSGVVS